MYLTTILLGLAIWFTAFGIHTNNVILVCIGGFSVAIYNAMMHKRD